MADAQHTDEAKYTFEFNRAIDNIRAEEGEEFVDYLKKIVLDRFPGDISTLTDAAAQKDYGTLNSSSHKLIGSLMILRCKYAAAVARDLNNSSIEENSDASDLVDQLCEILRLHITLFNEH